MEARLKHPDIPKWAGPMRTKPKKVTLEDVLNIPDLLDAFSTFVEEDLTYESLEFIQATQTYAEMFASDEYIDEQRVSAMIGIYQRYSTFRARGKIFFCPLAFLGRISGVIGIKDSH